MDAGKPLLGLAVAGFGGVCFGLMTPLMFIATSALPTTSHWRVLPYGCALEGSDQFLPSFHLSQV